MSLVYSCTKLNLASSLLPALEGRPSMVRPCTLEYGRVLLLNLVHPGTSEVTAEQILQHQLPGYGLYSSVHMYTLLRLYGDLIGNRHYSTVDQIYAH